MCSFCTLGIPEGETRFLKAFFVGKPAHNQTLKHEIFGPRGKLSLQFSLYGCATVKFMDLSNLKVSDADDDPPRSTATQENNAIEEVEFRPNVRSRV